MRVAVVLLAGAIGIPTPGTAKGKGPQEWKMGVVTYSHHSYSNDSNVAATSTQIQVAHEELDLDDGAVVYAVEEWVTPRKKLNLAEGSRVQFAISGKTVTVRLPDGKTRKLKLVGTYPRTKAPSTVQ